MAKFVFLLMLPYALGGVAYADGLKHITTIILN